MDEVEYERTLCQLPACHVFRIPPARGAEGHRASDWPQKPTWTGRLIITAKGRQAKITLVDKEGATFAKAPVTPGTVERTIDSGRYFVLRIENEQGKHAFIGLAFNERNDAFDFNVALQEHQNECDREDQAASSGGFEANESSVDLSLKQGEKIRINIGTGAGRAGRKAGMGGGASLLGAASGGGCGLLAPPRARGGGLMAPPPARGAAAGASAAVESSSAGMDFTGGPGVPGAGFEGLSAVAAPLAPVAAANPFGDPFGAPAPATTPAATASVFDSASGSPFGALAGSSSAPLASSDPFASSNPFGPTTSASPAAASSDPFASVGSLLDF
jgi:hypothetical protein